MKELCEKIKEMEKQSKRDESNHQAQIKGLNETVTHLNEEFKIKETEFKKCLYNSERQSQVDYQTLLALREQLHDAKGQLRTSQNEIHSLTKDKQDLLLRLSKIAGANLTYDNPNIADLSNEKRPTKLAEEFSELYDNEWTDAFEEVEVDTEEQKTSYMLNILMKTSKICSDLSMGHTKRIKDGFCKLILTHQTIEKYVVAQNVARTEEKNEKQVETENITNTEDTGTAEKEDGKTKTENTTDTESTSFSGNRMEKSEKEGAKSTSDWSTADKNAAETANYDTTISEQIKGETKDLNMTELMIVRTKAANSDTFVSEEFKGETKDPKNTKVKNVRIEAGNDDTTVPEEIKVETKDPNNTKGKNEERVDNTANITGNDTSGMSETAKAANNDTTVSEEIKGETNDPNNSKMKNETAEADNNDKIVSEEIKGETKDQNNTKEENETAEAANNDKIVSEEIKGETKDSNNTNVMNESKESKASHGDTEPKETEKTVGGADTQTVQKVDNDEIMTKQSTQTKDTDYSQTENIASIENKQSTANEGEKEKTEDTSDTEDKEGNKEDQFKNKTNDEESVTSTDPKEISIESDFDLLQKDQRKTIMDAKNFFETILTEEVKANVTDLICKMLKIDKENQDVLVKYIGKCVDICWSMCRQNPPVHVDFPEVRKNIPFDTNKYKPYTESGKYIDRIVWPPLFLHKGGPLLCKGVAQGKK